MAVTIGIYKITSPSNKIYIGQSWNIKRTTLNAMLNGHNKNSSNLVYL